MKLQSFVKIDVCVSGSGVNFSKHFRVQAATSFMQPAS